MNRRRFLLVAAGLLGVPAGAYATPVVSSPYRLRLLDARTGATFNGIYRDAKGPIARAMADLSVFLRDHHSGGVINFDVRVIDFLASVMSAAGQTKAVVLSAFRSFETNEMLAHTTFGVAEHSQHIYGRALDVHFDQRLDDVVRMARAMKRGGVGWYPHSGFIHLDAGPVRNWDIASDGLQELLLAPPATPPAPAPRDEKPAHGPGQLIVRDAKTPLVLSGRVSLTVH